MDHVREQSSLTLSDAERDRKATEIFQLLHDDNFRRLREWDVESDLEAFWVLTVRRVLLGEQS